MNTWGAILCLLLGALLIVGAFGLDVREKHTRRRP